MADVDPKLQSNRVKDLGGTVRPSRKIELAIIVEAFLILTVFALVCSHAGHPSRSSRSCTWSPANGR